MRRNERKEEEEFVIRHGKLSIKNNNNRYPVFFADERHNSISLQKPKIAKWRIKEKTITTSAALVLCLNLGTDPPDVVKPDPCARMETWMEPTRNLEESLDLIGDRLEEQYEPLLRKNAYLAQCLDPTTSDMRELCRAVRAHAGENHALFHYNGHGVPKPTSNGEIWVFDDRMEEYIPLQLFNVHRWMKGPTIYVFDCSSAGTIVNWFHQYDAKNDKLQKFSKDRLMLGACQANEILPFSPEYPADMFTSCLTTPLKMALRWFITSPYSILKGITPEMVDRIPGEITSRQTPMGELYWIFTCITETIAWSVFPRELFYRLFRQDLLVANLFRNFLLAERIMREAKCTPVSSPQLPPTHTHPLWLTWDLAVEIFLSQLPAMLNNPAYVYKPSSFFEEQLAALDLWLATGNKHKPPPEQLPIILQALLMATHRTRALMLLGQFLDLGPWAINLALSVGIFPYLLKILNIAPPELRPIMVFIWAKILALDKSCQLDLVQANGHKYFIGVITTSGVPADQRAMATFVLTVIVNNCRPGQIACFNENLITICLLQTSDTDPTVRRWMVLCLSKLWENFEEAKTRAIDENAHIVLCSMLQDAEPEVRAAAVYGLGTLIGGAEGNEQRTNIELNIGITLPTLAADGSPLVRKELVITLSHLLVDYEENFSALALEFAHEERLRAEQREEAERKKANLVRSSSGMKITQPNNISSPQFSSVYGRLWNLILELCTDPHLEVALLAKEMAHRTFLRGAPISPDVSAHSSPDTKPGLVKTLSASQPLTIPSSPLLSPFVTPNTSPAQDRKLDRPPSMDFASGLNFTDDYLPSTFYEWSANFYSQPLIMEDDEEDPREERWRAERNESIENEALEPYNPATYPRSDAQVRSFNNANGEISVVLFHPFEEFLVTANNTDAISVWNWEEGNKLHAFSNLNALPARISTLKFMNERESQSILLVGSTDGVIRVWRGIESAETLQQISAWRALPEAPSFTELLVDWQQDLGRLFIAGDVSFIRAWDAERELAIQDIPTECPVGITCISSFGNLLAAGSKDGSVRLFDTRIQNKFSVVRIFAEHKSSVVGVAMPKTQQDMIVSCSATGEVKFWQTDSTSRTFSSGDPTSSFATCNFAPVMASGSLAQRIKVMNFEGKELSTIKNHGGFLGQRISPVSCIAFHPYKMYLASGATDSTISIYGGNP